LATGLLPTPLHSQYLKIVNHKIPNYLTTNMATQAANSLYSQLTGDFQHKRFSGEGVDGALYALRKKGFEQFSEKGFPTIKQEDWKYTNLVPFLRDELQTEVLGHDYNEVSPELVAKHYISGLDAHTIVLINGELNTSLSSFHGDSNVSIQTINSAAEHAVYIRYIGQEIDVEQDTLAGLNAALFKDGLFIEVKAGGIVDKPLHIIHLYCSANNIFLQPRHLVLAHKNSVLGIIETFANVHDGPVVWTNSVTEVYVEENAEVSHYALQEGRGKARLVNHTEVIQQKHSLYNNYTFTLPGADFVRNNLNITLAESATETHLYGLYLAAGQQVVDNHTAVEHRKPNCFSNELYKGVLADNARSVFNGKVFVRQEAQKTNAFQQNNNLLLSDKAVVDSKPQLEIFADDVKCSHGSTIGQFNQDALFYLRARGIGEASARKLMVSAFAFDVVNKIKIPALREHVERLITENIEH
jgi:Fe-S cluster assembly protein SufD